MIIYTPPGPAEEIPIIDLTASFSPDLDMRRAIAWEIQRAARDTGFFYIKNDGIPDATLQSIMDCAHQFFALPTEAKMALNIANSSVMRGYEPMAI